MNHDTLLVFITNHDFKPSKMFDSQYITSWYIFEHLI